MDDSLKTPFISIVVPAYNEELALGAFYDTVSAQLNSLEIRWEMVFVNDGSKDATFDVLRSLHDKDSRVKIVHFSRNFGNQIAISAGLEHAHGDAVIVMDADLQQPPELLPEMIRLWKSGYSVVNTLRSYCQEIGWLKKTTSALFYRVMNALSDVPIIPGASDFRLMDRKVVDALIEMPERIRFLRAMVSWLGFRQIVIPFECAPRIAGTPSFSSGKLLSLAVDAITSFSTKPLRWILYLGCLTAVSGVPYMCWAIYEHLFLGNQTPGWASLIVATLFLGGVQLISLGVIGEYVGRIYGEVKKRPLYVLQEKVGFESTESIEKNRLKTFDPSFSEQIRVA